MNGAIDPQLGPLAYNGGPMLPDGQGMLTHALLPGSPAIDAGDPTAVAGMDDVPLHDQRGMPFSRVANGDDIPEARIDIGAFEWQPNPLPGDYNYSGVVDAADYVLWRKTLGSNDDLRPMATATPMSIRTTMPCGARTSADVVADPPAASAVASWQHTASPRSAPSPVIQRHRRSDSTIPASSTANDVVRRCLCVPTESLRRETQRRVNDEALLAWLAGMNGGVIIPQSGVTVEFSGRAISLFGLATRSTWTMFSPR